jgi:hypothetical protein
VSLQMSEGLNASRTQIRVTLAPEAKKLVQKVKTGGEWQLLWGYNAKTFRKVSMYWTGSVWSLGGNNTLELTLVNLGQYNLVRGTVSRSVGKSSEELAAAKGVKLAGASARKPNAVQSQVGLKEILRNDRESFIKFGDGSDATAEVVKFSELGSKAQVYYVSTSVGYVGEIKISYRAQLPKDQSYIEVLGLGSKLEQGPGLPTKPLSAEAQRLANLAPNPAQDSKETFGLLSFHVQDLQGKSLRSFNGLKPPSEGTSLLKLFVGVAIRTQVLAGQYSVSSVWQGKTIAQHLALALGESSSNESANALISRVGGITALNALMQEAGFLRSGFKSLYGQASGSSSPMSLRPTNSTRYGAEARREGYVEAYGENPQGQLFPEVTKAIADMRAASGLPLKLVSGFRNFATQESIWLGKPAATRARFSAPPGYSQHHTGLAVDLVTVASSPNAFERQQLQWLRANAQKYGFMFSYLNTSGDLGPSNEPWHLIWVGNPGAMAVFHEYISRAKALGYNPLNSAQEALFANPAGFATDKQTCCFDLCNAMASILAGKDPVSAAMQQALDGPFVGLESETKAKAGFTSKIFGVTLLVDKKYILSAYALGPSKTALVKGVKALSKSIIL